MEWVFLPDNNTEKNIQKNIDTTDIIAHMKNLMGVNKSKQVKKTNKQKRATVNSRENNKLCKTWNKMTVLYLDSHGDRDRDDASKT